MWLGLCSPAAIELASKLQSDLYSKPGVGSGLWISFQGKLNLLRLIVEITPMSFMWKWMSQALTKNHLLRYWDCLSLLNWIRAFTCSLLIKMRPRKFKHLFVLWSFTGSMVLLPYRRMSTGYSNSFQDFSFTIPRCYTDIYVNYFFRRTARVRNSLPE